MQSGLDEFLVFVGIDRLIVNHFEVKSGKVKNLKFGFNYNLTN